MVEIVKGCIVDDVVVKLCGLELLTVDVNDGDEEVDALEVSCGKASEKIDAVVVGVCHP